MRACSIIMLVVACLVAQTAGSSQCRHIAGTIAKANRLFGGMSWRRRVQCSLGNVVELHNNIGDVTGWNDKLRHTEQYE